MNIVMVTIDCLEPLALANWYVDAFDGELVQDMDGMFVMVDVVGSRLGFQKVDVLAEGKNRVHIDFHTDADLTASVESFVSKGAKLKGEFEMPGLKWVTLEDPQGNVFDIGYTG
jgi:predicted enzyme related to lactoylglutathione lyase